VGLSAQRIYQDLVCDHAFVGSYQAVKRFVRHLRETQPIPFVRMEVEPGAEAQVDFGQGAWVEVDGKRKRPHFFRVVLSHSRKGYSEVVWRQTTECFIRCLENSFRHFGGVPRTLVPDYVARNIIDLLFPPQICAQPPKLLRRLGRSLRFWSHNVYSPLSHFISSASSRQMGFRGHAPEEAEEGG
jgi:transposase